MRSNACKMISRQLGAGKMSKRSPSANFSGKRIRRSRKSNLSRAQLSRFDMVAGPMRSALHTSKSVYFLEAGLSAGQQGLLRGTAGDLGWDFVRLCHSEILMS